MPRLVQGAYPVHACSDTGRQHSHHRIVTISVTIETRLVETGLCSSGRKKCSLLRIIEVGSLLKWAVA
jgi:hypothetical protein